MNQIARLTFSHILKQRGELTYTTTSLRLTDPERPVNIPLCCRVCNDQENECRDAICGSFYEIRGHSTGRNRDKTSMDWHTCGASPSCARRRALSVPSAGACLVIQGMSVFFWIRPENPDRFEVIRVYLRLISLRLCESSIHCGGTVICRPTRAGQL